MPLPFPLKVLPENQQFYKITQTAYYIGAIGHAIGIPLFWSMGIVEMVYFNMIISVPAFLLALVFNRSGRHNLAFAFAFLELFAHQVATTYFTGWEFGAHFWLIYLAGLCFFNSRWNVKIQLALLLIVIGGYIGLFFFFYEGVYAFDTEVKQLSSLNNAVSAIVLLSLLINYFAKSTYRAEKSLIAEQVKTDKMLTKIEGLFGQQVSQEIAHEMIESETEIASKTYDASIMFLDIRDFTLFADSREPAEVANFQNIVFGELIEIVRTHKGVVLQILGDGIMAVFGAPIPDEDHALHAVQAGYAMLDKVEALGNSGKIPPIRIGIGVNAGNIIAGNVGNESRKFYSLTGKNVIIAARIEPLNKQFKSQFLISESVHQATHSAEFPAEDLGKINLKGIEHPVSVYKLR